jgi:hypothetical protein
VEESEQYVESPRILGVAALTIAAATVAVLLVREIAVRVIHPKPTFLPLTPGPPIVDTFFCTVAAIIVFVRIVFYRDEVRTWRRVAAVVLILSLIPDVWLATSHDMGGGWWEAGALMIMHVVVWAICVTLLPALAFAKHPRKTRAAPGQPLSIL